MTKDTRFSRLEVDDDSTSLDVVESIAFFFRAGVPVSDPRFTSLDVGEGRSLEVAEAEEARLAEAELAELEEEDPPPVQAVQIVTVQPQVQIGPGGQQQLISATVECGVEGSEVAGSVTTRFRCGRPRGHQGPHQTFDHSHTWQSAAMQSAAQEAAKLPRCTMQHPGGKGLCEYTAGHAGGHFVKSFGQNFVWFTDNRGKVPR